MDTLVTTSQIDALRYCEVGDVGGASSLLEDISDGPFKLLVEGAVLALQKNEAAKDKLSAAARLLDGELSEKAKVWLACCYWSSGEVNEARDTLRSVSPTTPDTRFLWHMSMSVFETANLELSSSLLTEIASLVDNANPLWRGKYHLQAGLLHRRQGRIDEAFISYEGALVAFEQVENKTFLAGAINNLSRLFIETRRYEEAHRVVDRAGRLLQGVKDKSCLGYNLDEKAIILLAEKKYAEAEKYARRAVEILNQTEAKEWLANSLLTHALVLSHLESYGLAVAQTDAASEIYALLGNRDRLLEAAMLRKRIAKSLLTHADKTLIETAISDPSRSFRKCADDIKITHSALLKAIRVHGLTRKPKRPLSIIFKPSK